MVATASSEQVLHIPLAQLHPHPKNTHGKLTPTHPKVVELRASITESGQNEPCIVRPKGAPGHHEILSGHIRTFAQELNGADSAPCLVKEVDDEEALRIVLTSNEKEPVDPLLEADAIAELLKRNAGDLRVVAKKLGKSVRTVALRSNLTNLSAKVRKLYADGTLEAWSVGMLEDLARLTPEAQDELASVKESWRSLATVRDQEDLDHRIGDRFHELGKATWKLDDAVLCPKAGACTSCPKTSLRAPGLFDDGDVDPTDPAALKRATCRDPVCWSEKSSATAKAVIAAAKKEDGDLVVVKAPHVPAPKGVKTVESWQTHKVEKDTKGAKPALFLQEDGTVKKGYVQPPRAPSKPKAASPGSAKEKKAPKPTDKNFAKERDASMKEVAERRAELVRQSLSRAIRELAMVPKNLGGASLLDGLLAVAGALGPNEYNAKRKSETALERCKRLFALNLNSDDWQKELWPRIREALWDVLDEGDVVEWLAELLGIDRVKAEAKAKKEIPDPKWWGPAAKTPAATERRTHLFSGLAANVALCGVRMGSLESAGFLPTTDGVDCEKCLERASSGTDKKAAKKGKR